MTSYEVEWVCPFPPPDQVGSGMVSGFSTQAAAEEFARALPEGMVKVVEVLRRTVWIRP